ncbi:hypothetical protein [Paenibacillus sp. An7]|uniref:hypothetical protein n=1 Tax=Paenibacillus sp. An7 TaxID=2689577 RepID=UPI00135C95BF|nr:hypothetical protein [Paenibacillus sp. An7]
MDNIWTEGYLHGNEERIFVNTSLGCRASCSYCYLPRVGYTTGGNIERFNTARIVLNSLFNSNQFIEGKMGTIISIGCFSECWDIMNKMETIQIIEEVIEKGNPIQLATKRFIDYKEILHIATKLKWEGQLSIFISCASISNWGRVEKGTVSPRLRFKSFNIQDKLGIPCYLYMKPVLRDITILDIEKYLDVIKEYKIEAIVGSIFSTNSSEEKAPILPGKLYYDKKSDEAVIKEYLSSVCNVYDTSVEPINNRRSVFA